jgi:tetratricopeptide (TPR) repeat protein
MQKPSSKLCLLLILVALTAGCATTSQQSSTSVSSAKAVKMSSDARASFDRALWSAQAGRDQEAIDLFREMTREHPGVSIGYTNLGLLQLKTGDFPSAEKSLQEAIRLNPADAVAQNHMGVVLREQGEFDKAKTAYLQALKLRTNYANAHLNLGILYDLYLQDLAQALKHYEQYQALTGSKDDTVAKWIVDLERRAKN